MSVTQVTACTPSTVSHVAWWSSLTGSRGRALDPKERTPIPTDTLLTRASGQMTPRMTGRPGRTYNIGGQNERTNLEVVHGVCDILDELRPAAAGGGRRELVEFVTDRPGHDLRYAIDADRIASELGWKPTYDFDTGLKATIQWYLDNRDWCEEVMRDQYDGSRLGLNT